MLELRPVCEHCNASLPPDSAVAMICSFECTFCKSCVEGVLSNVCPNCGGGFTPRPVRPSENLKDDYFLGKFPAGEKVRHKPVDIEKHNEFCRNIKSIPPERR